MNRMRWWLLFIGAISSVAVGFALALAFMSYTWVIFNDALQSAGTNVDVMIWNMGMVMKVITGWIVFGVTMTSTLVVASSLCIVMMVSGTVNAAKS